MFGNHLLAIPDGSKAKKKKNNNKNRCSYQQRPFLLSFLLSYEHCSPKIQAEECDFLRPIATKNSWLTHVNKHRHLLQCRPLLSCSTICQAWYQLFSVLDSRTAKEQWFVITNVILLSIKQWNDELKDYYFTVCEFFTPVFAGSLSMEHKW